MLETSTISGRCTRGRPGKDPRGLTPPSLEGSVPRLSRPRHRRLVKYACRAGCRARGELREGTDRGSAPNSAVPGGAGVGQSVVDRLSVEGLEENFTREQPSFPIISSSLIARVGTPRPPPPPPLPLAAPILPPDKESIVRRKCRVPLKAAHEFTASTYA